MGGWLWLLLFAAFFYLMMRFGCSAHRDREGHDGCGHGGGREVKDSGKASLRRDS
jgi:hypothetical protein